MRAGGERYVYGPVPSRRLGRSLGVDLVPFKTCTFDCTYCQLGRTTTLTVDRREYVPTDGILSQLEEKLGAGPEPDFIGLAGSGEPTLHSGLGEIIAGIKRMTRTKVAVLTNGSLLWMPEVRDGLLEADLVLPSLDAGDDRLFQAINRPHTDISFEAMADGIADFTAKFRGEVWLEVFLLEGSSGVPLEVAKIAAIAGRINPTRVQLNTVHRPPSEASARPLPTADLIERAKLFAGRVEIIAEREGASFPSTAATAATDGEILALIGRRPCSVNDVSTGLGLHVNEAIKYLERLVAVGASRTVDIGERTFYAAAIEPPAPAHEAARYGDSCRTEFWRAVFRAEIAYLSTQLEGARDVLSVGCGPADVEDGLSELGFRVTGLDVSKEALALAPDAVRKVHASAESIPLPSASFDAAIFVASLQFIDDPEKALAEAARVLRPGGRLVALLLNPGSRFFEERFRDAGSYISRVKQRDPGALEAVIAGRFRTRSEYLLGVDGARVFESDAPREAALYAVTGEKREGPCA